MVDRAVEPPPLIDGLEAQVVTLALASDIDRICRGRQVPKDSGRLAHRFRRPVPRPSSFWCAKATQDPEGLEGDLVGEGVEVITPNPKTSGGARWNYPAAWAWAEKNGKDPKAL